MRPTLHKISRGYYAMHFSQEIHEGCLKDCFASKNYQTSFTSWDIFQRGPTSVLGPRKIYSKCLTQDLR